MTPRETNNAKFFIGWLNNEKGLDFAIDESITDEQSHIDVIIKSKKLGKSVNIQNVAYRDGTIYGYGESNIPNFRPVFVLGKAMNDEERRETILNCIKGKEEKYQPSLVKSTLLLIEVTIPSIKPEEIQKLFPNEITTNFSGIYFVQLPVILSSVDDKYGQTGYVYPLKPLEFWHGVYLTKTLG